MADAGKHKQGGSIAADLKALFPVVPTRRTKVFAYGFVFAFVACTAFLAFSPSGSASSPWFNSLFTSSSMSTSIAPYRSQFSSLVSYFFPNSSSPSPENPILPHQIENQTEKRPGLAGNGAGFLKGGILGDGSRGDGVSGKNRTEKKVGSAGNGVPVKDGAKEGVVSKKEGALVGKNETESRTGLQGNEVSAMNQTAKVLDSEKKNGVSGKNQTNAGSGSEKVAALTEKNQTRSGAGPRETGAPPAKNQTGQGAASKGNGAPAKNHDTTAASPRNKTATEHKGVVGGDRILNLTASLMKRNGSVALVSNNSGLKREESIDSLMGCDLYQGNWVRDNSYPLYPEGSCPHIDEPFDCFRNGRPDRAYTKLRWQPNGCNIPRLNATDMLERLRGKRLVFVGDSLNRNMWESLICVLRNSVKDKKKVFELSGRHEFRTEGSYSFLFKDYSCTVEYFRTPFLVQEWEMPDNNGSKKETLRLDIVEKSASKYKDAHILVFNTGHWWTHDKTSKGRDYYQEGNHVYSELNVGEAYHKALITWARWVDANVNPKKTHVFFRGYSASHFSGGQWNSGGQCDKETEPIKNEAYLRPYPPKMSILEDVIKGMSKPVSYMNVTRMTDYRKDAHPSIYRKSNMTKEETPPDHIQDCSHWCLPGLPDSWNELLYAELLIKQHQKQH